MDQTQVRKVKTFSNPTVEAAFHRLTGLFRVGKLHKTRKQMVDRKLTTENVVLSIPIAAIFHSLNAQDQEGLYDAITKFGEDISAPNGKTLKETFEEMSREKNDLSMIIYKVKERRKIAINTVTNPFQLRRADGEDQRLAAEATDTFSVVRMGDLSVLRRNVGDVSMRVDSGLSPLKQGGIRQLTADSSFYSTRTPIAPKDRARMVPTTYSTTEATTSKQALPDYRLSTPANISAAKLFKTTKSSAKPYRALVTDVEETGSAVYPSAPADTSREFAAAASTSPQEDEASFGADAASFVAYHPTGTSGLFEPESSATMSTPHTPPRAERAAAAEMPSPIGKSGDSDASTFSRPTRTSTPTREEDHRSSYYTERAFSRSGTTPTRHFAVPTRLHFGTSTPTASSKKRADTPHPAARPSPMSGSSSRSSLRESTNGTTALMARETPPSASRFDLTLTPSRGAEPRESNGDALEKIKLATGISGRDLLFTDHTKELETGVKPTPARRGRETSLVDTTPRSTQSWTQRPLSSLVAATPATPAHRATPAPTTRVWQQSPPTRTTELRAEAIRDRMMTPQQLSRRLKERNAATELAG